MVQQALALLPKAKPQPRNRTTPAEEFTAKGNLDAAEHCRRQDRERAEAKAKITGAGKNPDGTPTPEAIAFVELCIRQHQQNVRIFLERNAEAINKITRDNLVARVHRELGIVARETNRA